MINRLSHATIWVTDQEEALAFYRDKLGFEVRHDQTLDSGFRWLTVGPPGQPDLDLVLMKPGPPAMPPEAAEQIMALIAKGAMGSGVFGTDDCRGTYAELSEQGRRVPGGARRALLRHRGHVPRQLRQLVQPHATIGPKPDWPNGR